MVHTIGSEPPKGHASQPDSIVFTEANVSWVHNPHDDAVVITIKVANSLVHRLLVGSRSAVNILYWGAYQKTGLRRADLTLTTSTFYGFTRDSVILKWTIKLAVILREPPRAATVVVDFLAVKCQLAFNGVLGRLLLKALKAVTSIHCLTMRFPTAKGTGQVWGR